MMNDDFILTISNLKKLWAAFLLLASTGALRTTMQQKSVQLNTIFSALLSYVNVRAYIHVLWHSCLRCRIECISQNKKHYMVSQNSIPIYQYSIFSSNYSEHSSPKVYLFISFLVIAISKIGIRIEYRLRKYYKLKNLVEQCYQLSQTIFFETYV